MLEKNSCVHLTPEEIKQYNAGSIPQRLIDEWQVTSLEELRMLLEQQKYSTNNNSGKEGII